MQLTTLANREVHSSSDKNKVGHTSPYFIMTIYVVVVINLVGAMLFTFIPHC